MNTLCVPYHFATQTITSGVPYFFVTCYYPLRAFEFYVRYDHVLLNFRGLNINFLCFMSHDRKDVDEDEKKESAFLSGRSLTSLAAESKLCPDGFIFIAIVRI